VEECSIQSLAKEYTKQTDIHYVLAAYNNMNEVRIGSTSLNLAGFEMVLTRQAMAQLPLDPGQTKPHYGYWAGGGVVIRKGPGAYEVMEVGGPRASPSQTQPVLTAVRTFCQSPFAEEPDTVYFGGYDCNNAPSKHTAWIYKGTFSSHG